MAQWRRTRDLGRVGLFVVMGALLIATSDVDEPTITFEADVDVPETVLDNATPEQRVTFRFSRSSAEAPREANVSILLQATHSDSSPQMRPDNTPWVAVSVVSPVSGAAGGPAVSVPHGSGSPFLQQGGLSLDGVAIRDVDGQGDLTLELSRAMTSDPITTRVSWGVHFRAEVPATERETRELPWEIEVVVDGGVQ